VKTDEQFAADIAEGVAFERELFNVLAEYIHGLEPPQIPDHFDGKIIGGFSYQPDMKLRTMVVAQGGKDERFYAGVQASLECKVRLGEFMFTSADDFPYPDIIVNEVYKTGPQHLTEAAYSKLSIANQKTFMRPFHSYWISNSKHSHVAVICPATKPLWTQRQTYSPKDRRSALNWHCPIRKPGGNGNAVFFGRFPEDVPHLLTRL
jgi:hypothetical protein